MLSHANRGRGMLAAATMSGKYGGRIWAFSVLLVILVLHTVAILLFTRGFLLTRTELPHYSQSSDVFQSPCIHPPSSSSAAQVEEQEQENPFHPRSNHSPNLNHTNPNLGYWTEPIVDRLVIIVLDALRFDFVAPSTFFEAKKPWMDRLTVLHELASRSGSSAKIFKAVADPPTTSLQRLKGLTTGGLPTFIDVGNSFGAPAIIEDNIVYQLVQNGKRVVMMGDDTWLQLFPHHFNSCYPFPSFNVKDLHTVDDGCIKHLLPSLYEEDWDVLIAHFLGVDHAGHVFGVDSTPMVEKLEQYNGILEKVVEVLESQSGPGGLHHNTLLLVMGDHGQTINGDHGGGNAEEVETSIFALSMKPPSSVPLELDTSSCQLDLDGRKMCISYIQQLDFAVTVSALLGLPFPFGRISLFAATLVCLTFFFSIGSVNPELYALAGETWNLESSNVGDFQNQSGLEKWMQNYVNVLCINSWQVKKYIDVYSASSVIGFSIEDLLHVSDVYAQAQENWSHTVKDVVLCKTESCHPSLAALQRQIDAYLNFLASVAELARSKWTEFNLKTMGIGFCMMLSSIIIQFLMMKRVDQLCAFYFPSQGNSMISFGTIFAHIAVLIRACSVLSNSYILEEGKVAIFLLATTGMLCLRYSIMTKKMLLEALALVLLIPILRLTIELGQLKQTVISVFLKIHPSWMQGIAEDSPVAMYIAAIAPMLALVLLAYILYQSIAHRSCQGIFKYVITGTVFSYALIALYWALESKLLSLPMVYEGIRKNVIPRIIYAVGFLQLSSLAAAQLFNGKKTSNWEENIVIKTVAMLSAWSSTVIILSGKQGALIAVASVIGGWCILRLKNLEHHAKNGNAGLSNFYSSPVAQWSLLAVCLFFCTGHWCAFDGLRYAAAFIGFDEFNLIRQAALLSIETFGFSHILPILGLPFLVACQYSCGQAENRKKLILMHLFIVYLIFGFIMATTVTFTILCVTIQRRHLMVWGLFAPKFVFDVVGLILTDTIICLASLYYFE
ncbi:unnamed protein product [Ilex paraguariensis]|uniref:GPI ethanolamine phosphate transferase 3 n=1 Tax=Ilex paraguariensis TaxID=185542 RepID=A0ABC8T942_9AQUA